LPRISAGINGSNALPGGGAAAAKSPLLPLKSPAETGVSGAARRRRQHHGAQRGGISRQNGGGATVALSGGFQASAAYLPLRAPRINQSRGDGVAGRNISGRRASLLRRRAVSISAAASTTAACSYRYVRRVGGDIDK